MFKEYQDQLDRDLQSMMLPSERADITLSPLQVLQIDEAGRRARATTAYTRQMSTHQKWVDPMQQRVMDQLCPEMRDEYARLYVADRNHKWRDGADSSVPETDGVRLSIGWAMFGVSSALLVVFRVFLMAWGGQ